MDTRQLSTLAREFAVLASGLQAGSDSQTHTDVALTRLARLAVDTISGADCAGVTVAERGVLRTLCSTDPLVQSVDEVQYALHDGPCIQALEQSTSFVSDDLRVDERWPEFATGALKRGVHAVMSFRLQLQPGDSRPASLNIYATKPSAFAEEGLAVGSLMVAHMDLALAADRAQVRAHNLEIALESNREIGVALGILMARHTITEPEAFVLLRRASQRTNRKVREVAAHVTQTGELPEPRERRAAS